ncbi:MAG TPA: OmpH family outer membrane protein, partial [bacterium]|nr:OmpH family outer membrane protein [bacterium]
MKNISKIGISAIVITFLLTSLAYTKDLKIGVVDVEKIYNEYEKAKAAREEIQGKRTEKQIELSKKQTELKQIVDEYNAKKGKMKEDEMKQYE